MTDNEKLTNENIEEVEDYLTATLTNEPSQLREIEHYKVLVSFQRPPMLQKYRHRAWVNRKLAEIDAGKDFELRQHFTVWSQINAHVIRILTPDENGDVTFNGKKYKEYSHTDEAYMSLAEQYISEEIYNKGGSDEDFMVRVWDQIMDWVQEVIAADPEDVKKS